MATSTNCYHGDLEVQGKHWAGSDDTGLSPALLLTSCATFGKLLHNFLIQKKTEYYLSHGVLRNSKETVDIETKDLTTATSPQDSSHLDENYIWKGKEDFANDMGIQKVRDNTPHPVGFPLSEFPNI